jgi:histidine triad (HIT) family protein
MITDACPFCLIIAQYPGATPIEYAYPQAVAFQPLKPVTLGHMLVVPRAHVPDFTTDPLQSSYAMDAAVNLARKIGGDMNLITSKGDAATQTIHHLHIHLVPRHAGDGLTLPWTPKEPTP